MKRNNNKKITFAFVVVGIVLFSYLGYRVYNDFINTNKAHKNIDSIELYEYTLSSNDNAVYKDNFKALSKVLNAKPINYTEYAKLLSKLFIIDLFTLNNKMGSTDIGGIEFIHKDLRDNFKENIGSSLYKFMEINLDGSRKQKLPEVKDVEIVDINESNYVYKDKTYEAYLANAKWSYVEDLGYQDSMKLTIIKDNNILYIVKGE